MCNCYIHIHSTVAQKETKKNSEVDQRREQRKHKTQAIMDPFERGRGWVSA